jgi:preprotein translocase subunit SecD
MKTIHLLTIAVLCAFSSCNPVHNANTSKVSFGIYETIRSGDIPDRILEKLKAAGLQSEDDTLSPVLGYYQENDSMDQKIAGTGENFKLIKTAFPYHTAENLSALIAVKPDPVIQNADIHKTKAAGNAIEIHFTMSGAKKWASMTKENVGYRIAFVIDSLVYDLPFVSAEIRSGVARIGGLENDAVAKKLSDELNARFP